MLLKWFSADQNGWRIVSINYGGVKFKEAWTTLDYYMFGSNSTWWLIFIFLSKSSSPIRWIICQDRAIKRMVASLSWVPDIYSTSWLRCLTINFSFFLGKTLWPWNSMVFSRISFFWKLFLQFLSKSNNLYFLWKLRAGPRENCVFCLAIGIFLYNEGTRFS